MKLFNIEHPILKNIDIEEFRSWPSSAKLFMLATLKREILKDLVNIKPKIHRLRISGKYSQEEIIDKFTAKWYTKVKEQPFWMLKTRAPGYQKFITINTERRHFDIFSQPYYNFMQQSIIEFSYATPDMLLAIYEMLPGMKISTVEYAIDFEFNNYIEANNFLHLLMHYLYIPNVGPTLKAGNGKKRYLNKQEYSENGLEYMWGPWSNRGKVYLRGPDNIPKKYWKKEQRIWVRYERTYTGDVIAKKVQNYYMSQLEPDEFSSISFFDAVNQIRNINKKTATVEEFAQNCLFSSLMSGQIKLCVFTEGIDFLPKEYDNYFSIKDHKIKGSFQGMVFKMRRQKSTKKRFVPSRHIKRAEGFDDLFSELERQINQFDENWRNNRITDEYLLTEILV